MGISEEIAGLRAEQKKLQAQWDDYFSDDFDGHSGSPGEWLCEALNAVDEKLKKLGETP